MPLQLPIPPDGGELVIQEALGAMSHSRPGVGVRGFLPLAGAGGAPHVDLALPHRVYQLGLEDAASPSSRFQAARPVGWRYLLVEQESAVASAQVSEATGGNAPEFLQIDHGTFPQATNDALHHLEESPELREDTFELRLLEVPAVYVIALWLHAPGRELFMPLEGAPSPIKANMLYPDAEFAKLLRVLAQARLKAGDIDLGPPRQAQAH